MTAGSIIYHLHCLHYDTAVGELCKRASVPTFKFRHHHNMTERLLTVMSINSNKKLDEQECTLCTIETQWLEQLRTMNICSRYDLFMPLRVNHNSRSGSKWRYFREIFSIYSVMVC